ncbi:hypothetical protein V5O48_006957 [Marasmius crinis-equi]|uniref:Class E vacuolar protein-sorting machinery protein HSE1 n=1 Tax=Marasmius crinis-equi TaxID=585013 RepID=A0ABR3FI15_9AGAR
MATSRSILPAPKWNESTFAQVWGNVDYPVSTIPSLTSTQSVNIPIGASSPSGINLLFPSDSQPLHTSSATPRTKGPGNKSDSIYIPSEADLSMSSCGAHGHPSNEVLPTVILGTLPSSASAIGGASPTPGREVIPVPKTTRNPSRTQSRAPAKSTAALTTTPKPFTTISQAFTSTERPGWGTKVREYEEGYLTRIIGYLNATASEDWSLVKDVCERISASENNAKEAVRALRKDFKYGQPTRQLSAARLWGILLRNSSEVFIVQSTTKRFLIVLEELLSRSRTNLVVRERVLDVLGAVTFANPDRMGFRGLWEKYKAPNKPHEGVPFDKDDPVFNPPLPSAIHNEPDATPPSAENDATSASLAQQAPSQLEVKMKICQALALKDYDGSLIDPTQFSFNEREVLDILDKEGKWWRARKANGIVGIAPSYHFRILDKAKALRDLDAASPDDPNRLSFTEGEVLVILNKRGKWWHARKADGTVGVVRSKYLSIAEPPTLSKSISTSLFRVKALYAYTASPDHWNELSFIEGDNLDILDKEGKWWIAKNVDGIFGHIPVGLLEEERLRPPLETATTRQDPLGQNKGGEGEEEEANVIYAGEFPHVT